MANLVELFDNIVQMQNLNGVPLAAGKLYVYALGRTRLMDSWSDVDGESLNPNPIILDDAGQAHVYVSDDFDYTLVVCDQYNNEIFSLDKYLYSKGSHSHADVAVAPSESIAVSSYHVGETTVYVPYLTGQLGKVYEGIDPIVVNNQVDKISANHVPLGVQDPLYFVQDDEEGCIIGFSGEALPEGTMNESAFGYEDGKITGYNGSGFSAGLNYEAGSYVDIDGNTINVTGLQPAGNYQSAGDYVVHDELSSYATQDWVENQSYMKEYMESAFYPSTSNPSGYLTEHQDLSDYAKTEDLTAYQPVGNYYSASNPDGFINSDAISAMATTGFVADVSADITAMIPTDLFTKESADTLYQPIGNYQSALTFNYTNDNEISGINGSAIYGQGGGVTGDYELSAGSGISIVDYPLEQKTVISVTAQGGNTAAEQAVIDNSATWNTVSDKLDTTAFSDVSGTFLTAHQSLAGYATEDWVTGQGYLTAETDWTNTITAASANAYEQATAAIPTGLATTGDLQTVSGEITAMIPSTAGLATTAQLADVSADVTALIPTDLFTKASADTLYQPIGNYLTTADSAEFMTTAERSDYIPTGVSSEFYTTANTANYISEVPTGTMNESAFSYDASDNITAYNGSAFKAGDEFPQSATEAIETVTANSADWNGTTETVNTNSGAWGGSALPISAGPGIKFDMIANTLVASIDETLLWSGADTSATQTLSENITAFEEIKVYGKSHNFYPWISQVWVNSGVVYGIGSQMWWNNPAELDISRYCLSGDKIVPMKGSWYVWAGNTATTGDLTGNAAQASYICKVVGINRIAGV